MILPFAWRYFKAKKSANAINIIAWVTTAVIAFATCCQVLVLSVFNGFESLVQSLYASFYTDLSIQPTKGKTFELSAANWQALQQQPAVQTASRVLEETALLQFDEQQTTVRLKGVDAYYATVNGVAAKTTTGKFDLGELEKPRLVLGSGIQYGLNVPISEAFPSEPITIILPKRHIPSNDPLESISEGNAIPTGAFAIQQEFDNSYAFTNLPFLQQQLNLSANEISHIDIRLKPGMSLEKVRDQLQQIMGPAFLVKTRFQQNNSLYQTMRLEKWAIFAILTLILIIAAFNMISALTMLVLEKKQDISILQSMGASRNLIQRIFLSEGMLLGAIGTGIGLLLAVIICLVQLKYHLIHLTGGSFLIDYFPVKLIWTDFLLVTGTALLITILASGIPARKAGRQQVSLR